MGFSVHNTKKRSQPEPDINVTPLVDVMLVLLIIFMVVTPALGQGDTIELPAVLRTDPKPRELDPIDLALSLDGGMKLGDRIIADETLRAELEALHKSQPQRRLMLKADTRLPYERIRTTFATVQDLGFRGVALKILQKEGG